MDDSTPDFHVHHQLPKPIKTHRSSWWNHSTILSSVILFSCLQSSQHQDLLKWVGSSHQVAKVLEFQLQHQSFQRIFRTDFLCDGLVGSPCSIRDSQESSPTHSSKASFLQSSAFLIVQLSHPYMTTGKTIALTRWRFLDKVMYLLFNMLSRLIIIFLPRSKCLLNSWLQSPSTVILEPQKIKSLTVSIVSLSIWHEVMGPDATILVF